MFLELTKVGMFLFVFTEPLNMEETIFHYFDIYVENGL